MCVWVHGRCRTTRMVSPRCPPKDALTPPAPVADAAAARTAMRDRAVPDGPGPAAPVAPSPAAVVVSDPARPAPAAVRGRRRRGDAEPVWGRPTPTSTARSTPARGRRPVRRARSRTTSWRDVTWRTATRRVTRQPRLTSFDVEPWIGTEEEATRTEAATVYGAANLWIELKKEKNDDT